MNQFAVVRHAPADSCRFYDIAELFEPSTCRHDTGEMPDAAVAAAAAAAAMAAKVDRGEALSVCRWLLSGAAAAQQQLSGSKPLQRAGRRLRVPLRTAAVEVGWVVEQEVEGKH